MGGFLEETAIIVPVWKRPEITEACFENLAKTECEVYCAVSETWAVELCHEFNFWQIYVENQPLGHKKNKLLEFALCDPWDQLLEIGSDNLLDLTKLDDYLSIPNDHYAPNCNYMVDLPTRRAKYVSLSGHNRIWGAGRVVSRQAVEKAFPLWDDKSNQYLDSQANTALHKAGYPFSVVNIPIFAGLKSEVNIHSYGRFDGVDVKLDKLAEKFPEMGGLMKHTH